MADTPAAGAPSDLLMAIYMGDRDKAIALARHTTPTLPELAALGAIAPLAARVATPGSDVHEYSPDGWTALHLAAFVGAHGAVTLLLRAGASTAAASRNQQGNAPLNAAIAGKGDAACVAALLAAGADVNAADVHGYTPLHLAASRGNEALCDLLVACGARRDVASADGTTPASIARDRGHPALAERLQRDDAWS